MEKQLRILSTHSADHLTEYTVQSAFSGQTYQVKVVHHQFSIADISVLETEPVEEKIPSWKEIEEFLIQFAGTRLNDFSEYQHFKREMEGIQQLHDKKQEQFEAELFLWLVEAGNNKNTPVLIFENNEWIARILEKNGLKRAEQLNREGIPTFLFPDPHVFIYENEKGAITTLHDMIQQFEQSLKQIETEDPLFSSKEFHLIQLRFSYLGKEERDIRMAFDYEGESYCFLYNEKKYAIDSPENVSEVLKQILKDIVHSIRLKSIYQPEYVKFGDYINTQDNDMINKILRILQHKWSYVEIEHKSAAHLKSGEKAAVYNLSSFPIFTVFGEHFVFSPDRDQCMGGFATAEEAGEAAYELMHNFVKQEKQTIVKQLSNS